MFFCVLAFFCEPPFTFTKTIDKPSMSMVSHKPFIQWQWFDCKKPLEKPLIQMVEIWKNHWKTIDTNDSHEKKPLKNHWYQWFTCKKTIEKPSTTMVLWQKPLTIPSWSKFYHRSGIHCLQIFKKHCQRHNGPRHCFYNLNYLSSKHYKFSRKENLS